MVAYTIIFDGGAVPHAYKGTGCTMPQWLRRLLGADRFDDTICRLHDFQRDYRVVSPNQADHIFRRGIIHYAGNTLKVRALSWVAYSIVRVMYVKYDLRIELPAEWFFLKEQIDGTVNQ